MTKRLLFLCTGNSSRSQLAEALMRDMAGAEYEVLSAGIKPEGVDPRVFEVLESHQIEHSNLKSTALSEFKGEHFDVVITLCDRANNECAVFADSEALIHWDFKDSKPCEGSVAFYEVFEELKSRIALFLMLNASAQETVIGPIAFFKVLSDPLRLRILMLIEDEVALTVGDLTKVLGASQPKVSRHLALLRDGGILSDQREGLWIFYRLAGGLPVWVRHVLSTIRSGNPAMINQEKLRLSELGDRKRPGFSTKK